MANIRLKIKVSKLDFVLYKWLQEYLLKFEFKVCNSVY